MAAELGVPTSQILPAVPLLFAGLLAGVVVSSLLATHIVVVRVVALGAAGQALALLVAAAAPSPIVFMGSSALLGIGFGVVESSGAALARVEAPGEDARLLAALTAWVAATAAVAPLLIVALSAAGAARLAVAFLAVPHLAAVGWLNRRERTPGASMSAKPPPTADLGRLVWPAAALFCYVGAESILAGWSAELPHRRLHLTAATAAFGTSAFWLLLTVGRLLARVSLQRGADPLTLARRSLMAVAAFLLLASALTGPAPGLGLAVTALAVIACGPCYAQMISAGLQTLDARHASAASARLVAAGALGGAALTALAAFAAVSSNAAPTLLPAVAAALAAALARRSARGPDVADASTRR